jgi:hypothetical protein
MTLNLKPGELGASGGARRTETRETAIAREIDIAEQDVARLAEQLSNTRNVKSAVETRRAKLLEGLKILDADLAELTAKEESEKRILRDRRVALLDLRTEIE